MKKYIAASIFLLLLITSVSALSTDLKSSYGQKETILIKFTGKITSPISQDQVMLKRANVQVPFEFELVKLGEGYFLWGVTPETPNNYTLIIENVDTIENGQPVTIDFSQSFSVTNETASLTIKPAIITTSGLFQINIISNIDLDQEIQIPLPERTVLVEPGENVVPFDASSVPAGLNEFTIADYPLLIYKLGSAEESSSISLSITEINAPFSPLFEKQYEFVITASKDTNIKLRSKDDRIELDQTSFSLSSGESKTVLVNVKTSSELTSSIVVEYDGKEISIPVKVIKNSQQVTPSKTGYYCSEIEGKQCSPSEVCSLPLIETIDIKECCTGTCQSQTSSSSSSWLGWILGLILVLLLGYLGLRYYKTKNKENPLKKAIK